VGEGEWRAETAAGFALIVGMSHYEFSYLKGLMKSSRISGM
jgi:hypothetical protein